MPQHGRNVSVELISLSFLVLEEVGSLFSQIVCKLGKHLRT